MLVQLDEETLLGYLRRGFDGLLAVVDRLDHERLNARPHGPSTNSVAALVVHCCGVTEYWLGHVGLGRASDRDRDAELRATATADDLRVLVARTLAQAEADVARLVREGGQARHLDVREPLPGATTDATLVLHVLEELFQHLGHAELTADALTS